MAGTRKGLPPEKVNKSFTRTYFTPNKLTRNEECVKKFDKMMKGKSIKKVPKKRGA